jgi:hypothetical protein
LSSLREAPLSPGTRCEKRWTANEYGEHRLEKKCNQCGFWKDAEVEYYSDRQYGTCKVCKRANNKAYRDKHLEERRQYRRDWYQRMRQDPYWLEMDKKRKKASRKPVDKARKAEADKRRRAKIYADPKLHAEFLEKRRIEAKMRRQRLGKGEGNGGAPPLKYPHRTGAAYVPIEPIREWIEKRIAKDGGDPINLAMESGVPSKRIYEYRHRPTQQVADLHVVEKLLAVSTTNLEDLYPDVDNYIAA